MWLLIKRLLTLNALVLMTAVSAQAALTFGAAPAADSLIQSVSQTQRFGAYLEKRLGEPVEVRIFPNDRNLKEALNAYYDVDLAVVRGSQLRQQPTSDFKELANPAQKSGSRPALTDMIVVRQGLDSALLARIKTTISGMEQDPEGKALLYNLGIQRFSLPADTKSAPKPAARDRFATPRPASPRLASTAPSPKEAAFTLGIVAAPGAPLRTTEAADDFAGTLGNQLKSRVTVRAFKDEATLHEWLNRYRMVELALLPSAYLQKQPAGEFELIAQPTDLADQGLTAGTWLVAQQGLDPRQLARLSNSLQQLKGAPLADLSICPAAATVTAPTTQPEVIRHARATKPPAVFAAAGRSAAKLTFGAVPSAKAPLRSEEQVRTFARLLGNRLGTTVHARTFKDQKSLQEWLSRYRMVDVGLFEETYLQKQPAGEFAPLLSANEFIGTAGSRLVGRQGLDDALLSHVRSTLQQMKNDPEVARLFQAPSTVAPVTSVIAPVAIPPRPSALEPEPVVVEVPAPVVKLIVTPAPPLVQTQPAPAIDVPKPEPVVLPEPPLVVEKLPEAPKPLPVPPVEPPVVLKPEPPEVVFRPFAMREQVFLAPFITVMVPGGVAETIFDTFVDQLNSDGMDRRYEFIILKGGLDSVDAAWLSERNYVTGEIFGYVEESGCCSTDIRTKSRVFLYRKGSTIPAMTHEHPVKIFFDHDYSTIAKERQNIADNIARELSAKVRDALRGS